MAPKIQLKSMLAAIDRGDKNFYKNLSPEQKKEFSPWLAMRWASSCKGDYAEHYMLMVNDIVNVNFSDLNAHPELQWKLLAVCGVGRQQYHEWIKPPSKKGKNKIQAALAVLFPKLRSDELALFEKIHTKAELKQIFKDAAYNDKEIKAIL